jgi:transcription elongation factor Elf1
LQSNQTHDYLPQEKRENFFSLLRVCNLAFTQRQLAVKKELINYYTQNMDIITGEIELMKEDEEEDEEEEDEEEAEKNAPEDDSNK